MLRPAASNAGRFSLSLSRTKMKKSTISMVMVAVLSILSGCQEEKPVDVVQTVDWYKANKAERLEMLAKCKNNPGELAATPNCINASRAASAITWGAKGGIQVEPLTAEDLKKNR
jgi:hypothetical protein